MIPMVIMAIESDTDRAYMTDVYMNHRSLMLKVAWRYTNAPSEVEDIVSESCVSLIQHLDSIRSMEEKTLRSYIVTTVKNMPGCFRLFSFFEQTPEQWLSPPCRNPLACAGQYRDCWF